MLRRESLSAAVNMLTNILKTLYITKRYFSNSIGFKVVNKYGKGGVVQISKVFGLPYVLLPEVSSERGLFTDLINHVFRRP